MCVNYFFTPCYMSMRWNSSKGLTAWWWDSNMALKPHNGIPTVSREVKEFLKCRFHFNENGPQTKQKQKMIIIRIKSIKIFCLQKFLVTYWNNFAIKTLLTRDTRGTHLIRLWGWLEDDSRLTSHLKILEPHQKYANLESLLKLTP